MERAVALYASDMPAGFRYEKGDEETLSGWIVQGAVWLGLEELFRSAACACGYRRLWLADLATAEQRRAHRARFADARRLDLAERLASLVSVFAGVGMAQEAKDRAGRPLVEGACRCGGTGWITDGLDPDDPLTAYFRACPGHNPNGVHRPLLAAQAVAA
ncbi:hypothetical protein ACFWYA_00565 [Streptomyces sp. NPDC059011]|uniref:hypothetical protein n=1 Tax=unclassified Streptomyces TaxID=2593676 RepID=UPI0036753926